MDDLDAAGVEGVQALILAASVESLMAMSLSEDEAIRELSVSVLVYIPSYPHYSTYRL